jgi:chemotaxis protein CheD
VRYTVGISEMCFGTAPGDLLVTHALGSCIGVTLHDEEASVGGILHYMLPNSSLDPVKAEKTPLMFGDTGIPAFFQEAYLLGARKDRLRVTIAGGANVIAGNHNFDIGNRNIIIARKLFWKNNVLIAAEHVGGTIPRTLYIEVGSGRTWFSSRGQTMEL